MPHIEPLGMGGFIKLAKITFGNVIQDICSFLTVEIIQWDGVFWSCSTTCAESGRLRLLFICTITCIYDNIYINIQYILSYIIYVPNTRYVTLLQRHGFHVHHIFVKIPQHKSQRKPANFRPPPLTS